jgi:hypothetical protein
VEEIHRSVGPVDEGYKNNGWAIREVLAGHGQYVGALQGAVK